MTSMACSTPYTDAKEARTPAPARPSYGPAVGRLAEVLGWPPMPWQRQVLDVALEIDPSTGDWCYPTVCLTVQRQAGKTSLFGPAALHRCLLSTDQRVWYTAQKRI